MNGLVGLDYNVLFSRIDRLNLSGDICERIFQDIRVIESEALSILNQKE